MPGDGRKKHPRVAEPVSMRRLFLYAVRKFFNNRIREDFAGDPLDQGSGGVGGESIGEGKREILTLADRGHLCETDLVQRVLDGLALGVQDRCLQRDVDMCLHFRDYISSGGLPPTAEQLAADALHFFV
jgi:hypothetical protein